MKILDKNFIEFKVDIGFNRYESLKKYFGIDELSGELNGCYYNPNTGIATFSIKLLPFIFDYLTQNNLDTTCLAEIQTMINSIKIPIDTKTSDI